MYKAEYIGLCVQCQNFSCFSKFLWILVLRFLVRRALLLNINYYLHSPSTFTQMHRSPTTYLNEVCGVLVFLVYKYLLSIYFVQAGSGP